MSYDSGKTGAEVMAALAKAEALPSAPLGTAATTDASDYDPTGSAASAINAHEAAADPHPQYATAVEMADALAGKMDSPFAVDATDDRRTHVVLVEGEQLWPGGVNFNFSSQRVFNNGAGNRPDLVTNIGYNNVGTGSENGVDPSFLISFEQYFRGTYVGAFDRSEFHLILKAAGSSTERRLMSFDAPWDENDLVNGAVSFANNNFSIVDYARRGMVTFTYGATAWAAGNMHTHLHRGVYAQQGESGVYDNLPHYNTSRQLQLTTEGQTVVQSVASDNSAWTWLHKLSGGAGVDWSVGMDGAAGNPLKWMAGDPDETYASMILGRDGKLDLPVGIGLIGANDYKIIQGTPGYYDGYMVFAKGGTAIFAIDPYGAFHIFDSNADAHSLKINNNLYLPGNVEQVVRGDGQRLMPLIPTEVENLPAPAGLSGAQRLARNGRKAGEGVGAGTGCPVWCDGTHWRTYYDNSVVAA